MNDQEFTTFITALEFAAEKHRFQRRKDEKESAYITHPIQLVEQLWNIGEVRDSSVLTAALMHDVIEDTSTEDAEIAAKFGQKILGIVKEVSDDKTLPKLIRKALQVEHASSLSFEAKLVKLADKICNVRDIRLNTPSPAKWPHDRKVKYIEWCKQVVDRMRGTNPLLEAAFDAEFAASYANLLSNS